MHFAVTLVLAALFFISVVTGAATALPFSASAPTCVFNVQHYGAKGDGVSLDTDAIMRTIAAAVQQQPGPCPNNKKTVLFPGPRTVFLTGPLDFSSTQLLTLYIQKSAAIKFSSDRALHKVSHNQYMPLLRAENAINFTITGDSEHIDSDFKPTIFGEGEDWWPSKPSGMEPSAAPIPPYTVSCVGCPNFELSMVRVVNCPFTCINAKDSDNVLITKIDLKAPVQAPNIAGVYCDGLRNSRLTSSRIQVSDDCITVMAWTRPSYNVVVDDLLLLYGQGLSFGSMIFHGVTNVSFTNIIMQGSTTGIRVKAQRSRGGALNNVVYENISLQTVGIMFSVELDFKHTGVPSTNPPSANNFVLKNVSGWGDLASVFRCIPESPCVGWRFENVFAGNSSEVVLPYICGQHFHDATLHNDPPSQAGWPQVCDGIKVI